MITIPSVSISGIGQNSASWTINDLSNVFTSDFYNNAYVVATWSGGGYQASGYDYPAASGGTTSKSASGSINGLPSGTFISIQAYATAANGTAYSSGTTSFTTASPPTPTMNPVTIAYRQQGAFGLTWTALSGASNYTISYKQSSSGASGTWSTFSTTGTSYYLSVGTYGVQYDFKAIATLTGGGTSNSSYTTQGTSQPKTPAISGQVTNGSTFTIYTSGMQGNWSSITVERLSSTGSYLDSKTITPSGNQYVQWLNMPANTTNQFRAYSSYSSLNSPYSDNTITLQNNRPEEFSWTYEKSKDENFNLTATEWNNLTSKINEFRAYRLGTNSSYSFTQAQTGSPFYAVMFNQAVNAINGINNPSPTISPPSTKMRGDIITASDINQLKFSINSVQ
ncbi:hypothetical protein [Paenibacillus sp. HB172176]|uniref:hypothetical protein n=1 Tax=Paenibacillus sp. HB172176 TaxID=2493690 RepID=UPI00143B53CA|nr:hypothetical protein [Paenibacillus sp. HB172176]